QPPRGDPVAHATARSVSDHCDHEAELCAWELPSPSPCVSWCRSMRVRLPIRWPKLRCDQPDISLLRLWVKGKYLCARNVHHDPRGVFALPFPVSLVERFVNSLQAIDAYAHVENMI